MNKASIFMNSSWVGLAGLAIALAGLVIPSLDLAVRIGLSLTVFVTLVMLWARKADEYTLGLWNAGAAVAFGTMLIAYPGLPFAEGMFDGITAAERSQDIPASVVPALAIVAFYIGLFVKRLLGDS